MGIKIFLARACYKIALYKIPIPRYTIQSTPSKQEDKKLVNITDKSKEVKLVQGVLRTLEMAARHYSKIVVDGVVGPVTVASINSFSRGQSFWEAPEINVLTLALLFAGFNDRLDDEGTIGEEFEIAKINFLALAE